MAFKIPNFYAQNKQKAFAKGPETSTVPSPLNISTDEAYDAQSDEKKSKQSRGDFKTAADKYNMDNYGTKNPSKGIDDDFKSKAKTKKLKSEKEEYKKKREVTAAEKAKKASTKPAEEKKVSTSNRAKIIEKNANKVDKIKTRGDKKVDRIKARQEKRKNRKADKAENKEARVAGRAVRKEARQDKRAKVKEAKSGSPAKSVGAHNFKRPGDYASHLKNSKEHKAPSDEVVARRKKEGKKVTGHISDKQPTNNSPAKMVSPLNEEAKYFGLGKDDGTGRKIKKANKTLKQISKMQNKRSSIKDTYSGDPDDKMPEQVRTADKPASKREKRKIKKYKKTKEQLGNKIAKSPDMIK